jgi:hypothetical protein
MPPECDHSPSPHSTMYPLPDEKLSMHWCVEQNWSSVAWL